MPLSRAKRVTASECIIVFKLLRSRKYYIFKHWRTENGNGNLKSIFRAGETVISRHLGPGNHICHRLFWHADVLPRNAAQLRLSTHTQIVERFP